MRVYGCDYAWTIADIRLGSPVMRTECREVQLSKKKQLCHALLGCYRGPAAARQSTESAADGEGGSGVHIVFGIKEACAEPGQPTW